MDITDADKARRLIENALGGTPQLTEQQFDDLLSMAEKTRFVGDEPVIYFSDDSLRGVVVVGCGWKAALTADKYEIAAGGGRVLNEDQWHLHWVAMAEKFARGLLSVTGGGVASLHRPRGVRSIRMVSSSAEESNHWPESIINLPEPD